MCSAPGCQFTQVLPSSRLGLLCVVISRASLLFCVRLFPTGRGAACCRCCSGACCCHLPPSIGAASAAFIRRGRRTATDGGSRGRRWCGGACSITSSSSWSSILNHRSPPLHISHIAPSRIPPGLQEAGHRVCGILRQRGHVQMSHRYRCPQGRP